jgi:hypothetical protein
LEKLSVKIFDFNDDMLSEQVVEEIIEQGYHLATAHEIMAFGEKYPELQRQGSIIALGSAWRSYRRLKDMFPTVDIDTHWEEIRAGRFVLEIGEDKESNRYIRAVWHPALISGRFLAVRNR